MLTATEILAIYNYTKTSFEPVFQNQTLGIGSYIWNVKVIDNQSNVAWGNSNYSFSVPPPNSAPTDSTPTINSTDGTNYSTVDLNCYDTISDSDSDELNITTRWYQNGTLYLTSAS